MDRFRPDMTDAIIKMLDERRENRPSARSFSTCFLVLTVAMMNVRSFQSSQLRQDLQ